MSEWSVYCLSLEGGSKTYVGATTNLQRRIRQHNDEIAGGARYTTLAAMSGKRWNPIFHVQGFPHKQSALQFEWALKRSTMSHQTERNLEERRRKALLTLMQQPRVSSRAEPLSSWPLRITHF